MNRKLKHLVVFIDLVLLKAEVKERNKILDLINEIKDNLNLEITHLGTQKTDIKRVNLQLQQLNKIDSLLRDFSLSKKNDLFNAKENLIELFK
ncbi:hypothetical protein J4459_02715 [Candidatus Woesearchaeota archaeon]|nr:hypothetical protein [Candidatus Woesearchaeota archaeon]